MNTNITLSPAKPYEGNAQFAAVGAAVKKLIASGLIAADTRWNRQDRKAVTATVDGRGGWYSADGRKHWKAARIEFWVGTHDRAAAMKTVEAALDKLTQAGWSVQKKSDTGVNYVDYSIVGPGFDAYSEAELKRIAAIDVQNIERPRLIAADEAEARQILANIGVERVVFRNHGTQVNVEIPLDVLRRISRDEIYG